MIVIGGNIVEDASILGHYQPGSMKSQIAERMLSVDTAYRYPSTEYLDFELNARKETVNASERLYNSFFSFRLFRDSKCNTNYWDRTEEGGFRLKKDANPHEAVRDILRNSKLYGTECATAIVMVYYLALVEVLPAALFDQLFADIYLMDWKYLDKDLGVRNYRGVEDALPGDCLYFKNPDVSPDTPEWQGENVIQLMNNYYYGHGIGIQKKEGIIRELNRNRIPNPQKSAYLMDLIVKPDFLYLARRYEEFNRSLNT